uniref:Glutaredoxin family protein, arsenate reductase n=1 Tax=Eubacterium cellulosolvens (strain ATCC 43171 / JCM 9499 / 6) TaxID=633697 RepID=I5AWT0_EUBC6
MTAHHHIQIDKEKRGTGMNMVNPDAKDQDAVALFQYIADEDKFSKLLENPQILKTPIVRNGKQATLGYLPDVWKKWE